jgi:hypothetical protein
MRGKEGASPPHPARGRASPNTKREAARQPRPSSPSKKIFSFSLFLFRNKRFPSTHSSSPQPMLQGGEELQRGERRHRVDVGLADRVEDDLALPAEEVELRVLLRRRARVLGEDGAPADVELVALEVAEDLPRADEDGLRDPREPRDLDAVRAVGRAVRSPSAGRRPLRSTPSRSWCGSRRRPSRAPSPSARGSASRRGRAARHVSWRCSAIAHASDRPSNVDVPRPISSRITRLFSVACLRMCAVSAISTRERRLAARRASPTRRRA